MALTLSSKNSFLKSENSETMSGRLGDREDFNSPLTLSILILYFENRQGSSLTKKGQKRKSEVGIKREN